MHKRVGLSLFAGLAMWCSDQDAAVREERVADDTGPEATVGMWLLRPCHSMSRFLWDTCHVAPTSSCCGLTLPGTDPSLAGGVPSKTTDVAS